MEFRTKIAIPVPAFDFSYRNRIMLLGSCFVEHIGDRLEKNKFTIDANPFGVLYNPASIAHSLRLLLSPERFTSDDLFEHEGVYHSFAHHSRFSANTPDESLANMNNRLDTSSVYLKKASRLIITFGTAYVYRLKSNGQIVSNCHKQPERMFTRERLLSADIAKEWGALMLALWEQNPDLKILFTVSPIRHWKDGAHANQLSKAALLLAIDVLVQRYPERVGYFPAYEIMMDELRDYRFYADDMLHPSPQAVEYIWETFAEHYFTAETREAMKAWQEVEKALNHKPFQPHSEAYRRFISQTLLKAEQIKDKFPFFDIVKEMELLRSKMNE